MKDFLIFQANVIRRKDIRRIYQDGSRIYIITDYELINFDYEDDITARDGILYLLNLFNEEG